MKRQLKESRIAYQSEWLEVSEDFLTINEIKNNRRINDDHQDNSNIIKNGSNDIAATNKIRMFNKIRIKNDGTIVIPVFPDGSLLLIETYRHGVDEVLRVSRRID
jgi:hypothetical protein